MEKLTNVREAVGERRVTVGKGGWAARALGRKRVAVQGLLRFDREFRLIGGCSRTQME